MLLVHANNLARVGAVDAAARLYESSAHGAAPEPLSPIQSQVGDRARAFCWAHALLADAIAETADTVRLGALADSIEEASVRSYYGRDWRLAHHVRGLIAMRAGRYVDAARELEQARWGRAGWTRTNIELAKADLALGRADHAQVVLREAYAGPLDAMGRYVPRSEIDYWMAITFARLGQRDSAAVYAGYVRQAWRAADPEVRRRLSGFP
jgi:tetratricopeptide (TPR) repeat protein